MNHAKDGVQVPVNKNVGRRDLGHTRKTSKGVSLAGGGANRRYSRLTGGKGVNTIRGGHSMTGFGRTAIGLVGTTR